ncbi:MAG TPA: protein-L-isoaspartate(D-aspartate) O-methyltransferase [Thermoanaerobaculia bacterium]|nr:protein-L-isoaspartate(D-aspartate) O-methyltransferase [Thermoanaerobaculia bacterium]
MIQSGDFQSARSAMVKDQLVARGIRSRRVLEAMTRVPRHRFVPAAQVGEAYADHPLPIGSSQTISQPYIVAYMTELLELSEESKVLEIGTGSGYQAAVLAELVSKVYSIEIVPELAERSRELLHGLGYRNVNVRSGDGYQGWPGEAPFDAIIVTAAPDHIPDPLLAQLAVGGRMVIPVGVDSQEIILLTRTASGIQKRQMLPVRFVPMTGAAQRKE